jgi:hypothetical protein
VTHPLIPVFGSCLKRVARIYLTASPSVQQEIHQIEQVMAHCYKFNLRGGGTPSDIIENSCAMHHFGLDRGGTLAYIVRCAVQQTC